MCGATEQDHKKNDWNPPKNNDTVDGRNPAPFDK